MMFRVSTLLAVFAVIGAVVAVQAQQVVSSHGSSTVTSANTIAQNTSQPAQKDSPGPEITDYPKYQIEYPADWKGPRIAEPQAKPAAAVKTTATTTAFRKASNTIKAISASSAAKTANIASRQSTRVIGRQAAQNYQPQVVSPSNNRYPSFYSPPGCLTGR